MLTFDQLEFALHKWAKFFRCNDFEHWELINAVWLKGDVQKLEHIEYASLRIKYDMIDYMRSESSLRTKARSETAGRFYPATFSLFEPIGDDLILQDLLESKPYFNNIDTKDLLGKLLKGVGCTAKLIINLRSDDFTFAEIAKIVGASEAGIWDIYSKILFCLQEKLVKMGLSVRKCSRVNKRDRSRYNHAYYEINKEQIQARKAKTA